MHHTKVLLDRPDLDQLNEEFESRQSKWLLDMSVMCFKYLSDLFSKVTVKNRNRFWDLII